MNKKMIGVFLGTAVAAFLIIFFVLNRTEDYGKTTKEITQEDAAENLQKVLKDISVTKLPARKANVSLETVDLKAELPEIDKYPLSVTGTGEVNIEIFSSSEKAGQGNDGWLNEMAEEFNASGVTVDGQTASVSVRPISSGEGADYIISGKYLPEAYTPSNELWGALILAQGGKVDLAQKRLVGNVAGILLSKDMQSEIVSEYGAVNMKTVTKATAENKIAMGYTNPLTSATGMNFLISTLNAYDAKDILSDAAESGFQQFQNNVPFVAFTTLQMRESAKSGSLTGMVSEYQIYQNDSDLKADYKFTPFGVRHDNPVYSVGKLSKEKKQVLDAFLKLCVSEEAQKKASEYGFNGMEDYKSELPEYDGTDILAAQKLWKENKDSGRPIAAVFVADVSGSMGGEPLNQLKTSLINGAQYIGKDNYIGLVSYDSEIYINLPIGKFDLNQRSLFTGAVQDLQEGGSTASFDGLAVGLDMLLKAKEETPDAKLMMFLLSDGETNCGHDLGEVSDIIKAYKIPIYTIGYNANIEALETISQINEAANINADSDDVIYKLKNLFNAQM